MKNFFRLLFIFYSTIHVSAQQTVGLFSFSDSVQIGYTLFGPKYSKNSYLIDNCGNQQYLWSSDYTAGGSVELLENGNLIRSCVYSNNSPINGGGAGGRIEAIRPDQVIDWSIDLSNDTLRQHHDFEVLPNGNILIIIWELISMEEALSNGRDSSLITNTGLWSDYIIEYDPLNDSIVWEWHSWDHLVQDYDSSKSNYGIISQHSQLFNLNYSSNGDHPDWQHLNSIDYNESLDIILICSPFWNEIYFIDHSTTIEESSQHSGGNFEKGGDILWRWGNPFTYGSADSSENLLFGQHDAHWIKNECPDSGKIILFNNGKNRGQNPYSTVNIIDQPEFYDGEFLKNASGSYLPNSFNYQYLDTTNTFFYSKILSSAEQLPNGNILINEGVKGHFFEINQNKNIVWDYVNPVVQDSILTQETTVPGNTSMFFNACFKTRKYSPNYSGISILDLKNSGPIEITSYDSSCDLTINVLNPLDINIFPNPAKNQISISTQLPNCELEISSIGGKLILKRDFDKNVSVNLNNLINGVYIINVTYNNNRKYAKFVKNGF